MKRLHITAEGQTEESFVKNTLVGLMMEWKLHHQNESSRFSLIMRTISHLLVLWWHMK